MFTGGNRETLNIHIKTGKLQGMMPGSFYLDGKKVSGITLNKEWVIIN